MHRGTPLSGPSDLGARSTQLCVPGLASRQIGPLLIQDATPVEVCVGRDGLPDCWIGLVYDSRRDRFDTAQDNWILCTSSSVGSLIGCHLDFLDMTPQSHFCIEKWLLISLATCRDFPVNTASISFRSQWKPFSLSFHEPITGVPFSCAPILHRRRPWL